MDTLSQSVQSQVRVGKLVDEYYVDPSVCEKQAFRTGGSTQFTQSFTNLGNGVSTFSVSPGNGLTDCILTFKMPTWAVANTFIGTPRGWGYALIKSINYRVGGSSQFSLSGAQVLQAALAQSTDTGSRDAILSLGGAGLAGSAAIGGAEAYCWLPMPWSSPCIQGKLICPTDLLTQSVQIQVELNPIGSIFSIGTGADAGNIANVPAALASATFQTGEVLMENQGDLLARRVDMTTHSYSLPCQFRAQEITVPLGSVPLAPGTATQANLTGFKSGEVTALHVWLTAESDTPVPAAATAQKPLRWYAPQNLAMSYGGQVIQRYIGASGQLWGLVNGRVGAIVNDLDPVVAAGAVTYAAAASTWSVMPFSQPSDSSRTEDYVNGRSITNGQVSLTFTIPVGAPNAVYTLHCSPVYNSTLVFSQGSADFVSDPT